MTRKTIGSACAALALFATAVSMTSGASAQSDPVVFSFATVGDNRQDPSSPDQTTLVAVNSSGYGAPDTTGTLLPQDNMYLQNSAAWSTIQANIMAQGPQILFFNGDMIYGYGRPILPSAWSGNPFTGTTTSGSSTYSGWSGSQTVTADAFYEYMEYAYWRGTVSTLFNAGTYVIPVPGNHETQCSYSGFPYTKATSSGNAGNNPNCQTTSQGNGTGKTAYAENENAFRANMSDLVQDLVTNVRFSNITGFVAQSVSGLTAMTAPQGCTSANSCTSTSSPYYYNGPITSPQNDLSYSFDIVPSTNIRLHFAIINTDPAGSDATPPASWLAADFAAAAARGATSYFVFGHKPAFTYNYSAGSGGTVKAGGLDANTVTLAYRNAFWSTMVQYGATYFSGHEHIPNVAAYADPTGTNSGNAYQVIVGSGGSPFDDTLSGTCTGTSVGAGCTEPVFTNPSDRWYAWAFVQVHASGRVQLNLQGFSDTSLNSASGQLPPVSDIANYDISNLP